MIKKALVVEDDLASMKIMEKLLLKRNVSVTPCTNGAEALYYYFTNRFYDIVLLDLMMPEVSGEDFIRVIDSLVDRKLIPKVSNIIVVSAVSTFQHLKKMTESESVHCALRKPLDIEAFEDSVDSCLRLSETQLKVEQTH